MFFLCFYAFCKGRFYARLRFMEVDRRAEKQGQKCREIGSEDARESHEEGPKQPFNHSGANFGSSGTRSNFQRAVLSR